jgi:hypothetical protein
MLFTMMVVLWLIVMLIVGCGYEEVMASTGCHSSQRDGYPTTPARRGQPRVEFEI